MQHRQPALALGTSHQTSYMSLLLPASQLTEEAQELGPRQVARCREEDSPAPCQLSPVPAPRASKGLRESEGDFATVPDQGGG